MKPNKLITFLSFIMLASFISCDMDVNIETQQKSEKKEYLKSWNDTQSKKNIIGFIENITNKNSSNFIKVEDRIATFDNDGTLWSEQPYYFQLSFAMDQIQRMAPDHPEWKEDEVLTAAINNDINKVLSFGEEGLLKVVLASHSGMSAQEFEQQVADWINTAKHPKTNKLYKEMVYQPMLEILAYLRDHDFKLFIVSGGGIDFMRAWVEEVYKIPKDQIIGTTIKTDFIIENNEAKIIRLPEIDFIDDKKGKPIAINRHIGRKPVISFGNSDGDLQMQQYTDGNSLPNLIVYIHHTDAKREWAYDRKSHIGKFDKGLDEAQEKGWIIVDMENDWKVIYPFDLNK